MLNSLSEESKKSLNFMMIIWFSIFASIFVYLIVCYLVLLQGEYEPIYSAEILKNNLFIGIDIYTAIYILAAIIFTATYLNFKRTYTKIVTDTKNKNFEDREVEFKSFKEKYLSNMFIHLALFDSISILGIIVFFLTLDFTTLIVLTIITAFGFILVMPNKSKFSYKKEDIYF